MPNILISNGGIRGFTDLGNCGIADRYYDLAVAEKSIIMNYGEAYMDLFYSCYGIEDIDPEMINFFSDCRVFIVGLRM